jgi:hypothetical protein
VIAALLLGFAAVGPALPTDPSAHQTVYPLWDARTKTCGARVDSVQIGDLAADGGEAALTSALSDKQRAVQLQGVEGIPYPCIDTVVSAIRKSGHMVKIGFLTEPAPH